MTTQRTDGSLFTSISKGVATIEFGHPASNSFPSVLLQRLTDEFYRISKLNDVSVIVLKSEGDKTFCAGASFDELVAINNLEDGENFFAGFANVINAMRNCSKLIITSVQGKAVGGGVGLIAASDYVLATESASVKLSEISIGIGPFVIAPAIERKIGIAGLTELSLTPTEWKTAYWAKEKGLFAKVLENKNELQKETDFLASTLASYNSKALESLKKIFWEGAENWNTLLLERAKISGELVLSDFTKKALSKFKK